MKLQMDLCPIPFPCDICNKVTPEQTVQLLGFDPDEGSSLFYVHPSCIIKEVLKKVGL
jgi:hypothetical protein